MTSPDAGRVEEVFDQARRADPAARPALLDSLCRADPALRAEVESLLRHDDPTWEPDPVAPGAAGVLDAMRQWSAGQFDPQQIGPYRILERLGEGAMGVVYLAEQQTPIHRRVALKVIKPGMDSLAVLGRFETEREALSRMDHPNVARALDAGQMPDGRPYFVMERVAGEPITRFCDRNNLSIESRLRLLASVCDGVQHAHQKGIIHRDIKPSNVLVSDHEGESAVKVIDFGVAKALHGRLGDRAFHTEIGQVIGTPEYMSPEQAEMGAADIDTRADVFSLGVLLFELLTGALPIDSSTLRSAGPRRMPTVLREHEVTRPSDRIAGLPGDAAALVASARGTDPASLVRRLRLDLDWIVAKATEKDRARRYASASELAADIRRALADEPVAAGPPSTAYLLRKLVRRHRGAFTATAAVCAALLVGIVGTAWQAHRAGVQRDQAMQARRAEAAERRKAESIAAFVRGALAASDPNRGGRQGITVAEAMKQAAARLDEGAFREAPEVEASLRLTIADILLGNGQPAEALAQAEAARTILSAAHPDFAEALSAISRAHRALGRPAEALRHQEAALRMLTDRRDSVDAVALAVALNGVGYCLDALGRDEEALARHEEALATLRGPNVILGAAGTAEVARSLNSAAYCLGKLGRIGEALPRHREALDAWRLVHPAPGLHPDVAAAMNSLALCLVNTGRPQDALPIHEEALRMFQRLYSGDHPDTAGNLGNVAFCLDALGRPAEALPLHRAALEMRRRLFQHDHPAVALSLSNTGWCLDRLKRCEESHPLHLEALEMYQRLFPGDHPDVARALNNLAFCELELGRPADALTRFEASLAMLRRSIGRDHPNIMLSLGNTATCLDRLGRHEESLARFDEALAMGRRLYGEEGGETGDHRNVCVVLRNSARCLHHLGQAAAALDRARRAGEMASRVLPPGHPDRVKCDEVLAEIQHARRAQPARPAAPGSPR